MEMFAKIKSTIDKKVDSLKEWYESLTNKDVIFIFSFVTIIVFLFTLFYAQTIKWEVYKQQVKLEQKDNTILVLNQNVYERDSLIAVYKEKNEVINRFVKELFLEDNFYTTRLTGYHPVPEQTDSTPDITADGTKFDIERAGEYRYVALSRDLLTHFNRRGAKIEFGDYIMIKGTPDGAQDGIYQVRDTMNKRHTQWIDILLTPGEKSFYYRNVLMCKIPEHYLDDKEILKGIYNHFPEEQPIAMVEPEVKLN